MKTGIIMFLHIYKDYWNESSTIVYFTIELNQGIDESNFGRSQVFCTSINQIKGNRQSKKKKRKKEKKETQSQLSETTKQIETKWTITNLQETKQNHDICWSSVTHIMRFMYCTFVGKLF